MSYNYKELYPINCEDAWESSIKSADSQDIEFKMSDDVYYFSNDWMSNHLEYWFSSIPTERTNMNILLVGVYEGRSTVFLHNHIFTNNKCKYYCIDNFGYFENKYYKRNNIDLRYNCIVAKERFLHNTCKFKDDVHLIEGNFNLSIVPENILFDIIILDTTRNFLLSDVKDCINIIKPYGLILPSYKISIPLMAKLKKIIPINYKLKTEFCRNKKMFHSISIQSS